MRLALGERSGVLIGINIRDIYLGFEWRFYKPESAMLTRRVNLDRKICKGTPVK